MTAPHIEICRDGPIFRVVVTPRDALPTTWSRPETYASHPVARMGAKLMGDALGWPVVDLTRVEAQ